MTLPIRVNSYSSKQSADRDGKGSVTPNHLIELFEVVTDGGKLCRLVGKVELMLRGLMRKVSVGGKPNCLSVLFQAIVSRQDFDYGWGFESILGGALELADLFSCETLPVDLAHELLDNFLVRF